jgi:hypothetical protein
MKKDQIKKSVGHVVRLIPIAHRLDVRGHLLQQIDDEWRIESVADDDVQIFLPRTGHGRTLGFDHIHQYTSDRIHRGVNYGFLTLNVQLSIQGSDVKVTPTRPGEAVPPKIPPDPIRRALLQQLHRHPGRSIHSDNLPQFPAGDVNDEIARCEAEGLLEARLLGDGRSILAAVAVRIRTFGVEWLKANGSF